MCAAAFVEFFSFNALGFAVLVIFLGLETDVTLV